MADLKLHRHAPYVAVIDCGGARHRLRVEDGGLQALDHGDPEGERALAALAGERCACIDTVDRWERAATDLRALILTSRGPGDELRPERPAQTTNLRPVARPGRRGGVSRTGGAVRATGGWFAYSPGAGGPVDADGVDPLVELVRLDAGLARGLARTVATNWSDRITAGDPQVEPAIPALTAALYGRAVPAVRRWLGSGLPIDLEMVGPEERPGLERHGDGLRVALPFAWLASVWARDLTVLLDRFVLAVQPAPSGSSLTLLTVGRDLSGPTALTLTAG